jgi:hypothetical protein
MFNESAHALTNPNDEIAREIIKTFHDLHRSWFVAHAGVTSQLITDIEEPALFFTRALFQPNTPFDSIVTGNQTLRALRWRMNPSLSTFLAQTVFRWVQPSATYGYWPRFPDNLRTAYFDQSIRDAALARIRTEGITDPTRKREILSLAFGVHDFPDSKLVQVGSLVGIEPATPHIYPHPLASADVTTLNRISQPPLTSADLAILRQAVTDAVSNADINAHYGGGILGSKAFFLQNGNLLNTQLAYKEDVLNRRLTSRIFEGLLCHQLPTLTYADISRIGAVDPSSPYPFRKQADCMRCHSSMDPLASAYRGMFVTYGGHGFIPYYTVRGSLFSHVGKLAPNPGSSAYPLQPPNATLRFRSLYDKRLTEISGLQDLPALGLALARSKDLYRCAVKRYYEYLTGVDVDLISPALPSEPLDVFHQNKVLSLADDFSQHKNVRRLLKDIFSSDAFQAANYYRTTREAR